MTTSAAPGGNGQARLSTKLVALITGLICLVVLSLVFFSHQGPYQLYLLRQEKARLDAENHRLAEENARLARIVDRLHHDKDMIQDLIRRELNFVKKNELIFQFPLRPQEVPAQAAIFPERPENPARQGGGAQRNPSPGRTPPEPRKTRP